MKSLFMLTLVLLFTNSCAPPANDVFQNDTNLNNRERDDDDFQYVSEDCPGGLVSGISLNDEFGPGTRQITRCIKQRKNIKALYQINKACIDSECSKPFALGNIRNAISDYEITNELILHENYDITMVIYSSGYPLVLDNTAADAFPEENPFQEQMEDLLSRGVHIYFCQNTARNKGIKSGHLIAGIEWVTSGVTAITDFQLLDYANINP